jgi:hypothetical protein
LQEKSVMALNRVLKQLPDASFDADVVQCRREHERLPMTLHGRLWVDESLAEACTLLDISPGGARITSRFVPAPGAIVRLSVSGLGTIEGEVVRIRAIARGGVGEFSVKFVICSKRRGRLATSIAWRFNVSRLGMDGATDEELGHVEGAVKVLLDDDRVIVARIFDVSLMGVTFESLEMPAVGSRVRIGELSGVVQHAFDDGFDVSFDPPNHPDD